MSSSQEFLVVGGDSLVGSSVVRTLRQRGHTTFETTRRADTVGPMRLLLDFESSTPFRVPNGVGYAFLIAAATNYDRCEKDPMARVINVELIPRTVASLLDQGLFVTYISTNSVFGGETPWPQEDDPHQPGIAYAQQKSDSELVVRHAAERLNALGRLNIVRLTKIMNASVSPLPAWFSAWEKNLPIEPFSDLVFAPMSVRFVGEALAQIGEQRVAGNLHLSGAENVNYVEFAAKLAGRLGVDPGLIQPTTATAKGIHIAFKPTFSGLGMQHTTQICGIRPQPIDELIEDLITDYRAQKA
ncbi:MULTISPECIES: sugar nucleotide-binding protein [unclassified Bradyrhizobium]|uniref:sugar nucleotide-binding protein n=1 Tax=unclassified Bradyrhizobium TaxID=2631580 RepID=UPI0029169681|nr:MULTISPECIES: sugar nucleotide-binding protein [unclassified Bradyrhizobium]